MSQKKGVLSIKEEWANQYFPNITGTEVGENTFYLNEASNPRFYGTLKVYERDKRIDLKKVEYVPVNFSNLTQEEQTTFDNYKSIVGAEYIGVYYGVQGAKNLIFISKDDFNTITANSPFAGCTKNESSTECKINNTDTLRIMNAQSINNLKYSYRISILNNTSK